MSDTITQSAPATPLAQREHTIEQDVRRFIADNLIFSDAPEALDAQASLIESDIIDSTSILELVSFLEEHFAIVIEDSEMIPANLDSLRAIARFIAPRLAQAANPGASAQAAPAPFCAVS